MQGHMPEYGIVSPLRKNLNKNSILTTNALALREIWLIKLVGVNHYILISGDSNLVNIIAWALHRRFRRFVSDFRVYEYIPF